MRKIVFTDCFLRVIIKVRLNDGGIDSHADPEFSLEKPHFVFRFGSGGIDTAKLFHFNYSNIPMTGEKKCRVEK